MSDDANELLLSRADERFQTLVIADKRIVLSAEDVLDVGTNTFFDGDYREENVFLYAETLLLGKSLHFKSGLVSSYWVLPTEGSVFSTSGAKGDDADARNPPSPDGEGGHPGGQLCWYTEFLDPDKPYLELASRGGAGGDGKEGRDTAPGGNGGSGGSGGQVLALFVHPYLSLLERLVAIYKDASDTAKREDLKLTIDAMAGTKALQPVQNRLQAALAGNAGALDGAIREAGLQLQTMVETWRATFKIDITGGAYGVWATGNPPGKSGKPGDPGKASVVLARTTAELASKKFDPFFLIHPVQCSLVLEKLKLAYFSADPINNADGVEQLAASLRSLRDRTELFTTLEPEHELAKYYGQHEQEFGALDSVATFKDINTNAKRLLDQLTSGLDYFGQDSGHVPLASFAFYERQLDEQIAIFKTIEAAYGDYYDQLKQNTLTMDAIRTAKEQQRRLIASAEDDISLLQTNLHSVGVVIDSYQVTLPPMKQKVIDKLDKLEHEIQDLHFDFNPKSFLSSLSLLAFAPESKLMWGVVIAQTAVSGVTDITNDQGDQVNKAYLVRQLKTIDGSLESVQEGYEALDDGQLKPDDPGAGKLLALEDKLSSALDDYYNTFPKALDELRALFKAYVDAIMARNEQVLKYNAIVILLAKKHDAVNQARAALASLADQTLDNLKPDLPALTSFVSQSYYACRNRVMETLATTARAYSFWALSDTRNFIADAFLGRSLPRIDSSALAAVKGDILGSLKNAVESFGGELTPFPVSEDQPGIMYELDAEQVNQFIESGSVMVKIPVADRDATLADNPFADLSNVRLLAVRVWVEGATSGDGNIMLDITHTGQEKIVRNDGLVFSFSHDSRGAQFRYCLKDRSIGLGGEIGWVDGDSGSPASGSTYALLGPFAYWLIEARDKANVDLDLSNVTAVRMEFRGKKHQLRQ